MKRVFGANKRYVSSKEREREKGKIRVEIFTSAIFALKTIVGT